jgi:ribonucleoside-diphosphate reductase alpha chain
MAALEGRRRLALVFGGEVRRTVRAADLWNRLMQATYDAPSRA